MKKVLVIAAVAVFGFSTANAQEITYGLKGGVNFATVGGDNSEEVEMKTAFHIGGVVEFEISDTFSVQPELVYSSQGAKVETTVDVFGQTVTSKSDLSLGYLNLPIMAKFYVAEGFSLEAGPQVGFLLSAKSESEVSGGGLSTTENLDLKDQTSSIDFGVGFGVGYKLESGLNFAARYNLGLSNINDGENSDDFKNHNNVIQVSVGYMF